ncbi:COPII-coated vesicle protein [Savitreella phatthalungensis]
MFGAGYWILVILLNIGLIVLQVFFTIFYSDLSCDYINPIDLVNKLNPYLRPEMALHAFITLTFLLTGNWFTLFLNLPIVAWNANKLRNNDVTLDATEIFRTLSKHQRESFFKLGAYLLLFFWYLYKMIAALID